MHILLAAFVFAFWGLVPIYYKQLSLVSAEVVMAHRIIWSVVLLGIFLFTIKKLNLALKELKSFKMMFILFICGALISADWGLYIYMIESNLILETSLGYFIAPLIGIVFSRIFLKEKMSFLACISVLLVAIACFIEILYFKKLPILSVTLALLVNFYTLIRKKVFVSAIYGFFLETLLICPFAIAFLLFLPSANRHFSFDYTFILLILSGLVTLLPMLGFNYATNKLKLSLLSYLQYICPIISFLVAIFIYNESLEFHKIISFSIILIAVVLSIIDSLRGKNNE